MAGGVLAHFSLQERQLPLCSSCRWQELQEDSTALHNFQAKMAATRLLIFDEISMIGRQMMGKISSRCLQARATAENVEGDPLACMSCVGVGDPAQCPPIKDDVYFSKEPHKDNRTDPDAPRGALRHCTAEPAPSCTTRHVDASCRAVCAAKIFGPFSGTARTARTVWHCLALFGLLARGKFLALFRLLRVRMVA